MVIARFARFFPGVFAHITIHRNLRVLRDLPIACTASPCLDSAALRLSKRNFLFRAAGRGNQGSIDIPPNRVRWQCLSAVPARSASVRIGFCFSQMQSGATISDRAADASLD
jgi:hypothetical protein